MPLPALLLILATLLPLVSFTVLVFLGRRMGNPLAGYFATAMIGGSFVCSIVAMMLWLAPGKFNDPTLHRMIDYGATRNPINVPIKWIPTGAGLDQAHHGYLDLGIYVDSLTIAMFSMVTLVAALVHVFSIGYMADDKNFHRFFTSLGLFCFSMLGLLIGGTLLQIFVFWELVGLCSYLLIGFWYERKPAQNAAIKAFVVNRVGDFGFLIGFGILFYHVGNASLPGLWTLLGNAGTGQPIPPPGGGLFTTGLLTVVGVGLFFGAVGKSAQFPLHTWLPDAMEGPTPVSALIHAATMVAAGVYLVGRIFPLLTPDAKLFIAVIGLVTLTMGALIACVQSDIKKVLAFSTISQLGYMMLAMGVGSLVGGLFHLITHAFFKALLFLGAGSVIQATHHQQELAHYGGLFRKMRVTGATFAIGVLAISGTPFFSGYYSKDLILHHAAAFATMATRAGHSNLYWAFFVVPVVVAYITAFYMTRCWMLTFWGKPRDYELNDRVREAPILWIPLIMLAFMSIIAGYGVGAKELLKNSITEGKNYCQLTAPGFAGFNTAFKADSKPDAEADPLDARPPAPDAEDDILDQTEHFVARGKSWLFYSFVTGIAVAALIYRRGFQTAARLKAVPPLGVVHTWLYHRMYFDELYTFVFVAITVGASKLAAFFDLYIVDGLVNLAAYAVRVGSRLIGSGDARFVDGAVNGAASMAQGIGAAVRATQTGRVRAYVTLLIAAVALGLAGTILIVVYK